MPVRQQLIAYPFAVGPSSGRFARAPDYDAYVGSLIRQVLLTDPGERINRPTFGAGLSRLVFAPISDGTATLAQTLVYESLVRWLGDFIDVERVETKAIQNGVEVRVIYMLLARGERRFLNVEVTL